ncbi:hypothetical protein [Paractinoplanes rishiriensis]|uniref:Uncharacterized protein n=1 Tax=Paractinoplanes rishiriensis TaxID=1050105 RepID=A0A919JUV1_9ACTN|nr:hypothetical protein [Actinoplanes rishiriensis]GIE95235.1 hypothetical protein Ari01nite_27000 [Actinoplanes rishiriensis]
MTATPTVVGISPVGRVLPSAVVVSTSPGDVARYAAGRLYLGCSIVVSIAPEVGDDARVARNKLDEAAMRLLGVQSVRLPAGPALGHDAIDGPVQQRLRERLAAIFEGIAEIWLPAGSGGSPFEAAVRELCATEATAAGSRLVLFAPAALGAAEVEGLVAPLKRIIGRYTLELRAVRLDDQAAAAKRVIIDRYGRGHPDSPAGPLDVEHSWHILTAENG